MKKKLDNPKIEQEWRFFDPFGNCQTSQLVLSSVPIAARRIPAEKWEKTRTIKFTEWINSIIVPNIGGRPGAATIVSCAFYRIINFPPSFSQLFFYYYIRVHSCYGSGLDLLLYYILACPLNCCTCLSELLFDYATSRLTDGMSGWSRERHVGQQQFQVVQSFVHLAIQMPVE